jgi:hypothetical protein
VTSKSEPEGLYSTFCNRIALDKSDAPKSGDSRRSVFAADDDRGDKKGNFIDQFGIVKSSGNPCAPPSTITLCRFLLPSSRKTPGQISAAFGNLHDFDAFACNSGAYFCSYRHCP